MPIIKFTEVLTYSSEDCNHSVENLLKQDTYLKWKSEAGRNEKQEYVVLKLEKLTSIRSIDIGNEHSAFVEILVSREGTDFQVILVASSFMSPLESRSSSMINRVRMFGPEKLNKNVAEQKWDRVKVICTQPFNKKVQYGLTFIKLYEPENKETELNKAKLGRFTMKDTSDDETDTLTVGSFFAKRQEKDVNTTGPAAIRAFSKVSLNPVEKQTSKQSAEEYSGNAPETEFYQIKKKAKVLPDPVTKQHSSPHSTKSKDKNNIKENRKEQLGENLNIKGKENLQRDEAALKKRKSRPFNQLMNDVVFVMSGYQNPKRSQLRDSLTAMGAKYKGDWGTGCTHLICAFKNTPKYQAVKGKGKIVSEKWVDDSFNNKIRKPWKRYSLEKHKNDKDSEDEIWATEICPEEPEEPEEKIKDIKKNQKNEVKELLDTESMNESEDTDDEIQRVLGNNDKKLKEKEKANLIKEECKKIPNDNDSEEDYDADTDVDEDFVVEKKDTSSLSLPPLKSFFKKKTFFLYGSICEAVKRTLKRYIIAFQGELCDYMSEKVNFVITELPWDENFDDALNDNPSLQFVKPQWIWKCCDKEKAVPPHPYLIVPDDRDD